MAGTHAENMNIIIAMDSFKGSMTSPQAGQSAAAGVYEVKPDACVTVLPVADGGEGTLEALSYGKKVQKICKTIHGPLGQPVEASYAIMEGQPSAAKIINGYGDLPPASKREDSQENCAFIEMAEAAGLTLVPAELRNPLHTTTYGVGELIADALDRGIRKFIIGIGGSATNDAGIGMLAALGWRFYRAEAACRTDDHLLQQFSIRKKQDIFTDKVLKEVLLNGGSLAEICGIDESSVRPELAECSFTVACDVTNPLYGTEGASYVYAPQKGATPEQVRAMDEWMQGFAGLVEGQKGQRFAVTAGAGAAGGMGFAMLAFLHARLLPGIDIVLEQTGAEEAIKNADLVLTGEGCLDGQTLQGKTVIGVARLAKKYGKPVYVFAGLVRPDSRKLIDSGLVKRCVAITPEGQALQEAVRTETACENLKRAVQKEIESGAV